MNEFISVSVERYRQLVLAEHDANCLKTMIADKYENYGAFDRCTLELLYTLYCGKKEDNNV